MLVDDTYRLLDKQLLVAENSNAVVLGRQDNRGQAIGIRQAFADRGLIEWFGDYAVLRALSVLEQCRVASVSIGNTAWNVDLGPYNAMNLEAGAHVGGTVGELFVLGALVILVQFGGVFDLGRVHAFGWRWWTTLTRSELLQSSVGPWQR